MTDKEEPAESTSSVSGMAVWAVIFCLLSYTVIGGAVGGLIAALIAAPITKMIPARADGHKIPKPVAVVMIVLFISAVVFRSLITAYLMGRPIGL